MKISAFALWAFCLISTLNAQTDKPVVTTPTHSHAPSKNADDPLIFKSIKNEGTHILIEYTIPFEGVVDLELMDVSEKIIYRNQYANRSGDNSIKFSTKPLKEGKYFYSLFYKGNEIRKYFDYRSTN
jgi:hypothetical protein